MPTGDHMSEIKITTQAETSSEQIMRAELEYGFPAMNNKEKDTVINQALSLYNEPYQVAFREKRENEQQTLRNEATKIIEQKRDLCSFLVESYSRIFSSTNGLPFERCEWVGNGLHNYPDGKKPPRTNNDIEAEAESKNTTEKTNDSLSQATAKEVNL